MKKKALAKPRVKAGTSKAAAAARRVAVAHAYIVNGRNWTQAAVTAGYKPGRAAEKAGERASKDVVVQGLIAEATKKAAQASYLQVELTLREISRAAYFNPKKLYDEAGHLIPVHNLPDEVAAALHSLEELEEFEGHGDGRRKVGTIKKVRWLNKLDALEKAMRYHGLYKEDNQQRGESIRLEVQFGRE